MKFNKWTVALAAVGAVSLASAARAEEKPNYLATAVASTTLSGYVDTSINWNLGTGNANVPGYAYNTPAKQDGFNLNSVKVTLEKPLDESEWASGYKVDLFMGPDANLLGTSPINSAINGGGTAGATGGAGSDFVIKQAYVTMRTPVGTGIDWKLGVFDTIIGYESTEDPNNPNYTRSYGYSIEPTTHTGLVGTYKITDEVAVTAGIANTTGPVVGGDPSIGIAALGGAGGRANPPKAESYKTYLASASFTAPTNWGWAGGSAVYAGFINGFGNSSGGAATTQNYYLGTTLNTPSDKLKVGASWDFLNRPKQSYATSATASTQLQHEWANAFDLYASFQVTEKMSLNSRAEYAMQSTGVAGPVGNTAIYTGTPNKVLAFTETIQYDLWKNVLSRLELRWDHQAGDMTGAGGGNGQAYGGQFNTAGAAGAATKHNDFMVALNLIYKF